MVEHTETTAIVTGERMSGAVDSDGIEIVRAVLDAFNRRDKEAIIELVDPEMRLVAMTGRLLREGEPYEGRDGLLRYFDDVARLWAGLQVEPSEMQSAGDSVVVIGYVHARSANGEMRLPVVWTWRLSGGRVIECVIHGDESAARRAAGIDET